MANPIIGQPDAFTKHAQQGYVPQQYAGQGYVQDPQLQYQQVPRRRSTRRATSCSSSPVMVGPKNSSSKAASGNS